MNRVTLAAAIALSIGTGICNAGAQDTGIRFTNQDDARVVATFGATSTFDWPGITQCAARQMPKAPPANAPLDEFQKAERLGQHINLCRIMLSARDAGWKESGAKHANPWPPMPMQQFGDWR